MRLAERLCCHEEAADEPEAPERDVEIRSKWDPVWCSRAGFTWYFLIDFAWHCINAMAGLLWGVNIKGNLRIKSPLNLADLGNCIKQHWNEMTAQHLLPFYASLPRGVDSLQRAHDYPLKIKHWYTIDWFWVFFLFYFMLGQQIFTIKATSRFLWGI